MDLLIDNRETEYCAWSPLVCKFIPDLHKFSSISVITCKELKFILHCYSSPKYFQLPAEAHTCSESNHNSRLMYNAGEQNKRHTQVVQCKCKCSYSVHSANSVTVIKSLILTVCIKHKRKVWMLPTQQIMAQKDEYIVHYCSEKYTPLHMVQLILTGDLTCPPNCSFCTCMQVHDSALLTLTL